MSREIARAIEPVLKGGAQFEVTDPVALLGLRLKHLEAEVDVVEARAQVDDATLALARAVGVEGLEALEERP